MENNVTIINTKALKESLAERAARLTKISRGLSKDRKKYRAGLMSVNQAKIAINFGNAIIRAEIGAAIMENQIVVLEQEN